MPIALRGLLGQIRKWAEGETDLEVTAAMVAVDRRLSALRTEDFAPDVQQLVELARVNWERLATYTRASTEPAPAFGRDADELLRLLDEYLGPGSGRGGPDLTFIGDGEVRRVVARDIAELRGKLVPAGADKSIVVLAGSICEALLLERLRRDRASEVAALAARGAPRDGQSAVRPLERWKLVDLITVACELGIVQQDAENVVDQSLRDHRNLIHPEKELRSRMEPTCARARLAVGALDLVLEQLRGTGGP